MNLYYLPAASVIISIVLVSCAPEKQSVDLIVHNAVVYTVDSVFSMAECFAVKEGKIIAVGKNDDVFSKYEATEKVNAQGKPVFPGFIDSHCHFLSYGMTFQKVDMVGTKSFNEVMQRVVDYAKIHNAEWIIGRGWDQNDWESSEGASGTKEFPDNRKLDSLFPNTPVYLKRVDGHAALANSEAMRRAGLKGNEKIEGGSIQLKNGKPTGILIDNAMDIISKAIPPSSKKELTKAMLTAQTDCFAAGITTIVDAGLDKQVIDLIDEMQKNGKLNIRVYAMLTDNKKNLDYYLEHGIYKTERLTVRSFKFYADGALGSRGACLLQPYSDKPEQQGFLLNKPEYYDAMAKKMYEKGFQMSTHCIGDSGNRFMVDTYGKVLGGKNDKRWRIEHVQVVNKNDFEKFGKYSIIPSVQSTHATSDMYWAEERVGSERVKGAYAYKDLLQTAGMIALGTDFPVENINQLYTFYASVARKDLQGFPENGFQMENALTREETLKGMTIWGAYSNFEEQEKGSIEIGKFADFIILDKDIMKININDVPGVKVAATYLNGEKVYEK